MAKGQTNSDRSKAPQITNRKARHTYRIGRTLECGIVLAGSEVKSVRAGKVSLGEGYARVDEKTGELWLHNVHIADYAPAAGSVNAPDPRRTRKLLAKRREIHKLGAETRARGVTLVPLKMYFTRGWAKLLIGVAHGKRKADKREDTKKREAERDIHRAMSKKLR